MTFAWSKNYPPIDVWIGLGDDAISGRGDLADAPPGYEQSTGLMFRDRNSGRWEPRQEPTGDGASAADGVGPLGLFAWLAQQQTGRQTAIVNLGQGGTDTTDWLPALSSRSTSPAQLDAPSPPPTEYEVAADNLVAAMSRRNATFRGFVTYLGLSDTFITPAAWRANWESTIAAIRAQLGDSAVGKPELVVQLPVTVPTDQPRPGWGLVRAAIASYAGANPSVVLVNEQEGPWTSAANLHLSTPGNYALAQRLLTAAMAHPSWE